MMQRMVGRFTILVAVVVLIGAGAGLARASVDDVASLRLVPSAVPSLLGPINSLGRVGWDCVPERAARAASAARAELPNDTDR
jgi:hypothetical protein